METNNLAAGVDVGAKDSAATESSRKFKSIELQSSFLLNSLPKSGTILLRNILMHFVGPDAINTTTLQPHDIYEFQQYPDLFPDKKPRGLVAHFPFYPQAVVFCRSVPNLRMVVQVRHPLDNSYSLARHISRPEMRDWDKLSEYIVDKGAPLSEVVFYCLTGLKFAGVEVEGVVDRYTRFLAWRALGARLSKYEDLIQAIRELGSATSDQYFAGLLSDFGIGRPGDWEERVAAGSHGDLSWTYTGIHERETAPEIEAAHAAILRMTAADVLAELGYRV